MMPAAMVLGDGFILRQATAADHGALSIVCLKTGDAGKDATAREDDLALLGLIYAIPYQLFEPDLAFVIDGPGGVSGYVLGALDTQAFNARLARDWYPRLRAETVDPGPDNANWRGSDQMRHRIHHPDFAIPHALAAYPSHGHIDLLPEVRGKGIGRRALAFLERRLVAAGSPGLLMQVDPNNRDALGFYEAVGFAPLRHADLPAYSVYMVKRLG
jgi:ribosomal protein S18 acetylase RimI-like enzyme